MSGIESGARRVTHLDGLRGLAALLVVFFHVASAFVPAIVYGTDTTGIAHVLYSVPILNLWLQGNFMVCVFYALSGFALTYASLARGGWRSAFSGLVRRYPRLAIPTVAATSTAAVMLSLSMFPVRKAATLSHSSWLGALWQFQPSLPHAVREGAIGIFGTNGSAYDSPLWTMHNELRGSILVFAVLILLPRAWLRAIAYVALAFLTYHSYLLGFVAGMAICEVVLALHRKGWNGATRRHLLWIVPLGVYGLLLGSYPTPSPTMPSFYDHLLPHIYGSGPFAQQIGSGVLGAILVLIAIVALVGVQNVFDTKPMQFLGRISFALYLFHFLVMGSLGAGVLILLHGPLPYGVAAFVAAVAVVVVSMAVVWVFTRLVDEPMVTTLKRVYNAVAKHVPMLTTVRPLAPIAPAPELSADVRP